MTDQIPSWIALLGGLGIGAILTQVVIDWLGSRRDRKRREVELRTRQLQELYGPLLSLHKEIRAHSELRLRIQQAVHTMPAESEGAQAAFGEYIIQVVQDENQTFSELLMPRYHEMVKIFQEKLWLAEPETREHFIKLIEFVFVWNKVLANRIPRGVAPLIGHTEENLKPFYKHLEEMTDKLRKRIGG